VGFGEDDSAVASEEVDLFEGGNCFGKVSEDFLLWSMGSLAERGSEKCFHVIVIHFSREKGERM
jgi:hypothetical protein